MRPNNARRSAVLLGLFWGLQLIAARPVLAYIDPGTTGMLSQILYVLFYGALGVFLYLFRNIKQHMANAKRFVAKLFRR